MSREPQRHQQRHQGRHLLQRALVGTALACFLGGGFATATTYWVQQSDFAAIVAGERISQVDYQRRLNETRQLMRSGGQQLPDALIGELALNQLIERALLLQEARRRGLNVPADEVETEWQRLLGEQFAGRADRMKFELLRNHYSEAAFRQELRERLLTRKTQEALSADVSVPERELRAHYSANARQWQKPERIEAWHLLIKAQEDKPAEVKKAKVTIDGLAAQLAAGAKFDDLVKKHSQDESSKDLGGKLEPFAKGEMVAAFEQAAWALAPGEVTIKPVQTPYGWHLIKRGRTLPAGPKSFDEARAEFEPRLLEERRQKQLQQWLQRQRQAAGVEINPALARPAAAGPAAPLGDPAGLPASPDEASKPAPAQSQSPPGP